MVDKSFLRGELFVLRCSFKNLLILRHILIGSLSYEGFYIKDRLDFPLAHGHRSVKPTCLGPLGPVFCFYLLHLYTFSHQKKKIIIIIIIIIIIKLKRKKEEKKRKERNPIFPHFCLLMLTLSVLCSREVEVRDSFHFPLRFYEP